MAQMQRVKVLRGFRHRQEIQAPGTVLDLEMPIAIELRTNNKVEFVSIQTPLKHETALPDPNKVLADRQAARAAAQATTVSKAAEPQKGAK
jgi:hypothetical protein